MITHLLLTHYWDQCLACHSSVKELALCVDSQKLRVGLLSAVEARKVKADLLMKDRF